MAKAPKKDQLVPFYGAVPPPKTADGAEPSLVQLAPVARSRVIEASATTGAEATETVVTRHKHRARGVYYRKRARRAAMNDQ
jgi:hypothetical protein